METRNQERWLESSPVCYPGHGKVQGMNCSCHITVYFSSDHSVHESQTQCPLPWITLEKHKYPLISTFKGFFHSTMQSISLLTIAFWSQVCEMTAKTLPMIFMVFQTFFLRQLLDLSLSVIYGFSAWSGQQFKFREFPSSLYVLRESSANRW